MVMHDCLILGELRSVSPVVMRYVLSSRLVVAVSERARALVPTSITTIRVLSEFLSEHDWDAFHRRTLRQLSLVWSSELIDEWGHLFLGEQWPGLWSDACLAKLIEREKVKAPLFIYDVGLRANNPWLAGLRSRVGGETPPIQLGGNL